MGHIDQVKGEFAFSLTADVGGSFGQPPPATPLENTLFIAQVMKRAGYDIANIGDNEARFGVDFLKARAKETGIPFISGNLVRQEKPKPVMPPYVFRKIGGLRVGILGLLDFPTPMPQEIEKAGLAVRDPLEAAREFVPRMRAKCDMLVVAAYMSAPRAREMAQKVEGIDLILCRGGRDMINPEKMGATVIAPAGQRSGHVAELNLELTPEGKIGSFLGEVVRLQELGPRDAALETSIREMMDRQARDQIARQREAAQAQAAKDQSAAPAQPGAPAPSPAAPATPVTTPGSPAPTPGTSSAAPAAPPPAAPGGVAYSGAVACQSCHQEVFEKWSGSPHASAFARLAESDDWNKAECLACHVTGYGKVAGSRDGLPAPEFWNVQCEACHGPGAEHVAHPGKMGKVEAGTCTSCHTERWSPGFDFMKWRARLPHG